MIYFAYGSNMDENQMKQRCPNAKLIGKALLSGYCLAFDKWSPTWGCGVADIVKDNSSEVWGLLYEVTEVDLENLDCYEGNPTFYRRVMVIVIGEDDKRQEAITYEVVNKESFVCPSSKYLNIIKRTSKTYNFSKDYRDSLVSLSKKRLPKTKTSGR